MHGPVNIKFIVKFQVGHIRKTALYCARNVKFLQLKHCISDMFRPFASNAEGVYKNLFIKHRL